ncbi:hypothetical protein EVAR_75165_1 [Eumeta japonica]|uniref:Uncharacterized protein n=1 Tax=Eumeta variegata TaxID=151549 RepID=A0A4C1U0L6_EUMVA|nr:hypothetical protein EVAR_75165_1 [Eumeta japonica]
MERVMLAVSLEYKIRNEVICRRTRVTDISQRISKLKQQREDRIARRTLNHWVTNVLEVRWTNVGPAPAKLKDDMAKVASQSWLWVTESRTSWKSRKNDTSPGIAIKFYARDTVPSAARRVTSSTAPGRRSVYAALKGSAGAWRARACRGRNAPHVDRFIQRRGSRWIRPAVRSRGSVRESDSLEGSRRNFLFNTEAMLGFLKYLRIPTSRGIPDANRCFWRNEIRPLSAESRRVRFRRRAPERQAFRRREGRRRGRPCISP